MTPMSSQQLELFTQDLYEMKPTKAVTTPGSCIKWISELQKYNRREHETGKGHVVGKGAVGIDMICIWKLRRAEKDRCYPDRQEH